MKKTFIVIAVFIVSLVAAMSAYALQANEGVCTHKEFGFKKYLGLSDEQLAKMKELRISFHNDTRDLRYNLAIKRLEMRKLFTDPNVQDAALIAKQKEISNLRLQLSDKKAGMKLKWRKVLTAEQISKLDRMPHGHHANRWAHHHHQDSQCPTKG
jgi:Spy/CpxP family protein refolding chaperone